MNETVVLPPEKECAKSRYGGMTALLKPTELVSAISSQLKALCEAYYAVFILKYMWVPV
jgi:hypothetical protein